MMPSTAAGLVDRPGNCMPSDWPSTMAKSPGHHQSGFAMRRLFERDQDGGVAPRTRLWAEKVGLMPPWAGNAATRHGTAKEGGALQQYQELSGHRVSPHGLKLLHDDPVHGWLGASPDGLIDPIQLQPGDSSSAPSVHFLKYVRR